MQIDFAYGKHCLLAEGWHFMVIIKRPPENYQSKHMLQPIKISQNRTHGRVYYNKYINKFVRVREGISPDLTIKNRTTHMNKICCDGGPAMGNHHWDCTGPMGQPIFGGAQRNSP